MKNVNVTGDHFKEIKTVLKNQKRTANELVSLEKSASQVLSFSIDPLSKTDKKASGLLYGLIQSGKTSVMIACAALAVDNGYKFLIIFTADNKILYAQTLTRIKISLRGMNVIGKDELKDHERLKQKTKSKHVVFVCSKNQQKLSDLHEVLNSFDCKDLPAFIIDDEADQASLNTFASKAQKRKISRINELVGKIRKIFSKVTFLQVTATPQALFLQAPGDEFRPSFTVLSEPGEGYVGGDQFFGNKSGDFLRDVDMEEIELLKEESDIKNIPPGLAKSLYAFLIGATAKVITEKPDKGYSYFCHVTLKQQEQKIIVDRIEAFKEVVQKDLEGHDVQTKTYQGLKLAYDDLSKTDPALPKLDEIVSKIPFYLGGASIKLINSSSKDEVSTVEVFNLLVGGNKLGRGVTIENLLISYYGRNPKRPNADTVLQHARMYGYRTATKGVTRLFLPESLVFNFKSIHLMETALRRHFRDDPQAGFECIFTTAPLRPTRSSVVDPSKVIYYVGGSNYNPLWPLRAPVVSEPIKEIDGLLKKFKQETIYPVNYSFVKRLISLVEIDEKNPGLLWNKKRLAAILNSVKAKFSANLIVIHRRQGKGIQKPRGETRGILSGGEVNLVKKNRLTLFMIKQPKIKINGVEMTGVWWPQIRFPDGSYYLVATH